jgi:hypothetical protein
MNKDRAEEIAKSAYASMSYIKGCELDVWTKARSAGPALPEYIPTLVVQLEERLPGIREAAAHYHNGPDFIKEVETFVAKRKGKTYAFGQACPWVYK